MEKAVVLFVFVACYGLALSGKVKLAYASIGAAAVLLLSGIVTPFDAFFKAVKWDVMGIYWGFMMVSSVFMKSRMPELIANRILSRIKEERYVIFALSVLTAFLSAFMENVGVVLMMAPVALTVSRLLKSDLFPYMIAIAICSNVVTTLTMVADPPAIILALETGMKPLDFYWFHGRIGLGTITLILVAVAMLTLLFIFRRMKNKVSVEKGDITASWGATILFAAGVLALAFGPEFGVRPGIVGFAAGLVALYMGRRELWEMIVDFDWDSLFFIIGVFIVIYALNASGLLKDFADAVVRSGIKSPTIMLAFLVWVSVALSSFMDNVPYTILMIPVCQNLAATLGIDAWPLLYGMLIGTGIGGNITPVGATANVFARGILQKHGVRVTLGRYLKLSVPFSVTAVLVGHILLQLFWM